MNDFVCRLCGSTNYHPDFDLKCCNCMGCGVMFESTEMFTLPNVKFIKLDKKSITPKRSKDGDVGYDAMSIEDMEIPPHTTVMVKTGISVQLPPHTEMQVRSRSGMAKKYGVFVINGPGTIDTGYRGPCNVLLHNTNADSYHIEAGDAIAQFLVTPKLPYKFVEVNELDETERGEGGFGHTGR